MCDMHNSQLTASKLVNLEMNADNQAQSHMETVELTNWIPLQCPFEIFGIQWLRNVNILKILLPDDDKSSVQAL